MKTIKRMLMVIATICGLAALWLSLTAARAFNPCEFANNNIQFVKEQTQLAIDASELKMSKYYAYKALNGIWNAEYSFSECGCEDAFRNMELASDNLKEATRANRLEDSRVFLQIAMKSTLNSINAIKGFRQNSHDTPILSMNVDNSVNPEKTASENLSFSVKKIEESLDKYSKSIDNVIKINDCDKAKKFIAATRKKTQDELMDPNLTQRKHYFHNRVLQITEEALKKLESCSGQSLLAGK